METIGSASILIHLVEDQKRNISSENI
ncbi:uncharacterized protein METZ01_LOCUS429259 [marine metagenome]|uniref:Uncharacterized protein n=1 Tax=marine metagenome TaxID=408172 RepID=A0A382Y0L2_9ZZZZ